MPTRIGITAKPATTQVTVSIASICSDAFLLKSSSDFCSYSVWAWVT
jgi:hypothetical protein